MLSLTMTAALMLSGAAEPITMNAYDVPFFERRALTEEVDVIAIAVVEDSRCASGVLCIQAGQLVVGVIVRDKLYRYEMKMEVGASYRVEGGTIALISTSTPPSDAGAIHLSKYVLDFEFTPDLESNDLNR